MDSFSANKIGKRSPQLSVIISLGLFLIILSIYFQASSFEFLNYDDDIYITNNTHVQSGLTLANIKWAAATDYASNWHPITWLSHMLDCQLFQLKAGAHHLVGVGIHALNTILLFLLLRLMTSTLWRAAFVAALFACHPLHVESVAWVSERKDVLSTLFWILTLYAYHYYLADRNIKRYLLVLLCFLLGLGSKPMLVTLPFTLFLLDHWPYNRWLSGKVSVQQIILEKIPLIGLSLLSCLITYNAQQAGSSVVKLTSFHLSERFSNAIISYVNYLNQTIWPTKLAVFYPYPDSIMLGKTIASLALLAAITRFCWVRIKTQPYLATSWAWYICTLVPVIGIVQVGEQAMADRYTYMPLLGIFVMVTWGTTEFFGKFASPKYRQKFLAIAAAAILATLTLLSYKQTSHWQNNKELFQHAVSVTENNYFAHFQLGTDFARNGKLSKAETHLREAIKIKPEIARAHNNLALVLERSGKTEEAFKHYRKAANLDPGYFETQYNLGLLLLKELQPKEAIQYLQRSLKMRPNFQPAKTNLNRAIRMLRGN